MRVTLGFRVAALLGLTGCGPSLGSYKVAEVELVEGFPDSVRSSAPNEPLLRIEVASDFDLVAEASNIYSFIVDCAPLGNEHRMIYGPIAAGEPPLSLYDAEPEMPRDSEGLARYWIYLRVAAPAEKPYSNAKEFDPPYDLRSGGDDLCIRIKQAGYFITSSQSREIRISRDKLEDALRP